MLKDLLLKYLAKINGISEKKAAALIFQKAENGEDLDESKLNDDVLNTLLDKDAARVQKLSKGDEAVTKAFDNGYNKALKEEKTNFEKLLRKRHNIDEEGKLKLNDLLDKIDAAKIEKQGTELTEENIKKHPLYLSLERSKKEEIETLTSSHETALKELENKQASSVMKVSAKNKVLDYFDNLKPVLSKEATKAANQRTSFANLFDAYDFQAGEGDADPLIIDPATNKRLEDKHGNPVSLADLVQQKADQYYDFVVQDPKGAPGNKGGAGGDGVAVPDSKEAYETAILEAKTSEERIAIADAYEAANKSEE